MKTLRWIIFTILFLAIVAGGMAMSFNLGCRASVLSADFYKEQFTQHNIYDLSQHYVLLKVRENMNQQLAEPVRNALTYAVEQSFSPEWTRQETSRLIDSLLAYLTNQQDELDLMVDLKPRKDLLLQVVNHQIGALAIQDSPLLQIIGLQTKQIFEIIGQYLHLPDAIDLGQSSFFAKPEVQQYMQTFRVYYSFTPYLPYFLLLLFIALLFNQGIVHGCKWFGVALALSSILFMVLLAAGGEMLCHYIQELSANAQPLSLGMDPVLLAHLFAKAAMGTYLKAALLVGLPGALLAGASWLWEYLMQPVNPHKLSR